MLVAYDQAKGPEDIQQELRSLGGDDHYERLILYIALASRADSKLRDKAMAQALILTHLGTQPIDPVVVAGTVRWIIRTWRVELAERRFRLATPMLFARVLEEIAEIPDSVSSAARILLAAEMSAQANYDGQVRSGLVQLAR
jgi:hypothetical protein